MKHLTLTLAGAMVLALATPTFAQRTNPSGPPSNPGGRPSGVGPGTNGGSGTGGTATHTDMPHASPSDVLSHNAATAGRIQTLTGQDAQAACAGFKNLGQGVAAAHVAKNLDIPGGSMTDVSISKNGSRKTYNLQKTYRRNCKPLSPSAIR